MNEIPIAKKLDLFFLFPRVVYNSPNLANYKYILWELKWEFKLRKYFLGLIINAPGERGDNYKLRERI